MCVREMNKKKIIIIKASMTVTGCWTSRIGFVAAGQSSAAATTRKKTKKINIVYERAKPRQLSFGGVQKSRNAIHKLHHHFTLYLESLSGQTKLNHDGEMEN